ncbi:MAG: leucine-rich repeat domain-containing protein [Sphaerochaetaceae bacterium]|jgi:hypothetical protein
MNPDFAINDAESEQRLNFERDEVYDGSAVSCPFAGGMVAIDIPCSCPNGSPVVAIAHRGFVGRRLRSVSIPPSVRVVRQNAFDRVATLEYVCFRDESQLETIDSFAFSHTGLKTVLIPSNVKTIGAFAFLGIATLRLVEFQEGTRLATIETSAFSNTRLSKICVPASVTVIGCQAFKGVESLVRVEFPQDSILDEIFSGAFEGCGITLISIPKTVRGIGSRVFKDCICLETVVMLGTVPPWLGYDAFLNTPSLKRIVVPSGSKATYRSADGWSCYSGLIEEFLMDDYEYAVEKSQGWKGKEWTEFE